eukprot:s2860_g20.t1
MPPAKLESWWQVGAVPMGADDLDAETLKRLKREAAIRSKEQDFERRKKAEERKKREQLQALREEYEAQQQKREQERLSLLKKQTELRARKKAENDRLNELREKNIKKRHKAWRARADAEIQHIKEDQAAEEERLEEAIAAARQRKADRQEAIRQEKMDKQTKQEELDMSRATFIKTYQNLCGSVSKLENVPTRSLGVIHDISVTSAALDRAREHMRSTHGPRSVQHIAATLRLWVDISLSILSHLGVAAIKSMAKSEEAMLEEIGKMQGPGGFDYVIICCSDLSAEKFWQEI